MDAMDQSRPFFRGHEGYAQIITNEDLARPGRAIRVYDYGKRSGDEKLYVIGTDNQLFDAETGNKVDPKKVLSRKAAPDGWSVEGLELALLPEEELNKVLSSE